MGQESSQPEVAGVNGRTNGSTAKLESEEEQLEVEERGMGGEWSVKSKGMSAKKSKRLPRTKEKKRTKRKSLAQDIAPQSDSLEINDLDPSIPGPQPLHEEPQVSSSFRAVNTESKYDSASMIPEDKKHEARSLDNDNRQGTDIREAMSIQLVERNAKDGGSVEAKRGRETVQETYEGDTVSISERQSIQQSHVGIDTKRKRKRLRTVKPRNTGLEADESYAHITTQDDGKHGTAQEQDLEILDDLGTLQRQRYDEPALGPSGQLHGEVDDGNQAPVPEGATEFAPRTHGLTLQMKKRYREETFPENVEATTHSFKNHRDSWEENPEMTRKEDTGRLEKSRTNNGTSQNSDSENKAVKLLHEDEPRANMKSTGRRLKALKSRRLASQLEFGLENELRNDSAVRDFEDDEHLTRQLPTPEASRKRPVLATKVFETDSSAVSHPNMRFSSQSPQHSTASKNNGHLQSPDNTDFNEVAQHELQLKKKEKSGKSAGDRSSRASDRKRKRKNNVADIDNPTDEEIEEMFKADLNTSLEDLPIDDVPDEYESSRRSRYNEDFVSSLLDHPDPPGLLVQDLSDVSNSISSSADDDVVKFSAPVTLSGEQITASALMEDLAQKLNDPTSFNADTRYSSDVDDGGHSLQPSMENIISPFWHENSQVTSQLLPKRKQNKTAKSTKIRKPDVSVQGSVVAASLGHLKTPPSPSSIISMISDRNGIAEPTSTRIRDSMRHEATPPPPTASRQRAENGIATEVTAYPSKATEESAIPMIGIYKEVNGIFHRRAPLSVDSSRSSGKWERYASEENKNFEASALDGSPVESLSTRKKRRAPTENDSVFDMEEIEGQTKRKKARTSLKPQLPLSKRQSTLASGRYTPQSSRPPTAKSASAKRSSVKRSSSQKALTRSAPATNSPGQKKAKGAKQPTVKGQFSEAEIRDIADAMATFRESHDDMLEIELNQLVQDNASNGAELWDALCDVLPGRSRASIMKICRRRYHNYGVRGKWTEEEDQELKEAYNTYPKGWKKIGDLLNRHPEDARDRWRNYLICGNNQKKDVWSEQEEDDLRVAILECLSAIREMREQNLVVRNGLNHDASTNDMEYVDWQMVSAKLNHTRSRLQCMTKWKSMRDRENADNGEAHDLQIGPKSWRVAAAKKAVREMASDEQLELLLAIQQSQAGREGKVRFRVLGSDEFKKNWNCMARKVAWKKMRATVPGNGDMKLQDIVTILIDEITDKPKQNIIQDNSEQEQEIAKKSERSKVTKRLLSDAYIASDDEQTDEPGYERNDTSEEMRTLQKGEAMRVKRSPSHDLFDEYTDRRPSPEDIHHSIEDMYDGENDVQEGYNESIPESPVRVRPKAAKRGHHDQIKSSFLEKFERQPQQSKQTYHGSGSSDDDDFGDIPARLPARQESLEL